MTVLGKIRVGICGFGERISHVARTFVRNDSRFEFVGYVDPAEKSNGLMLGKSAQNSLRRISSALTNVQPALAYQPTGD
ncbi:hypothetical protein DVR09_14105 [Erythrobacter aureus]|uniref:Uncharacterized protein n=1 Tax=Erythrobacter aureus TaxID=2182384 RepID=A0A345YH91_9SPHN|nr:hypothetical protein DVR09_14105 [Erythrobacter aureus]